MPRKNKYIRPPHTPIEMTPEQVMEFARCAADPVYFAKNYVKVQHPTRGSIPFELYDYQEEMMRAFMDHKFNIVLSARQTGKSVTAAAYLLWFAAFYKDKKILIASNKNKGAMEMIKRIKYAYENLPMWLKPGASDQDWTKHSISFDNESQIDSTATSEDSGRGESISLLYLDEFAFVKPNIQDEFWASILPTLSTGGDCIITSTPNGDANLFAILWRSADVGRQAENKDNVDLPEGMDQSDLIEEDLLFYPTYVPWDAPPGRDDKFKRGVIAKFGERKWRQEYECEFLSSDALLIDSLTIAELDKKRAKPLVEINDVTFWDDIKEGDMYIVGVDPSTGSGLDFSVINLFHFPSLNQVAEYRSNTMSSPELYKKLKWLLRLLEKKKCNVYFSVENNGVGEGLIALYQNDESPPATAEMIHEQGKKRYGLTTTGRKKIRACLDFKLLVEKGAVHINSEILIKELKSFVRKKGAYEAQTGSTDDNIMSVMIVVRVIAEIAEYEQDAFEAMYSMDHEEADDQSDDDDALPIVMGGGDGTSMDEFFDPNDFHNLK